MEIIFNMEVLNAEVLCRSDCLIRKQLAELPLPLLNEAREEAKVVSFCAVDLLVL